MSTYGEISTARNRVCLSLGNNWAFLPAVDCQEDEPSQNCVVKVANKNDCLYRVLMKKKINTRICSPVVQGND